MNLDTSSPEQDLPLLNLTAPQQQVIAAHLNDAIMKLLSIRFVGTEEQLRNAISNHAFESGKREVLVTLLQYDQMRFAEAQKLRNEAASTANDSDN